MITMVELKRSSIPIGTKFQESTSFGLQREEDEGCTCPLHYRSLGLCIHDACKNCLCLSCIILNSTKPVTK